MPKYFLSPGATPLDHLTEDELIGFHVAKSNFELRNERTISLEEKWNLSNALWQFASQSVGGPQDFRKAMEMVTRFKEPDAPKSHLVSSSVIKDFRDRLGKLKAKVPKDNEMGLRFYLGKDSFGKYGIVIVPMYGPIPLPTDDRDRTLEREKTFFKDAGINFFALVPGADTVSEDEGFCKNFIIQKDSMGKGVVYVTEEAFSKFIDSLEIDFDKMLLYFGRTENDEFLTLISLFLGPTGIPITSRFGTTRPMGICFDQGDLIPPPPSGGIVDSSF